MNNKAALLITGQPRTYKQVYQYLEKYLLYPNKGRLDIFLCFWDKTHKRKMEGQKLYEMKDIKDTDVSGVLKKYNPKSYTILKTEAQKYI